MSEQNVKPCHLAAAEEIAKQGTLCTYTSLHQQYWPHPKAHDEQINFLAAIIAKHCWAEREPTKTEYALEVYRDDGVGWDRFEPISEQRYVAEHRAQLFKAKFQTRIIKRSIFEEVCDE